MVARTVFAPAKINLGLRITGRFANGYHRLESIFLPIGLYDRLTISPADRDEVFYDWGTADHAQKRQLALGAGTNPLLRKSIAMVRSIVEASGGSMPGQRIMVHKRIPSPSGLGGASADAAVIIDALLKTFAHGLRAAEKPEMLRQIAALGADVPFFLFAGLLGKAARLHGLGFELTQVTAPALNGWTCVPEFGFSTKAMFDEVRKHAYPTVIEEEFVSGASASNLTLRLNEIPYSDKLGNEAKVVQNDFEPIARSLFPARYQALRLAMRVAVETAEQFFPGSWLVGMTGSGPGIFAMTAVQVTRQALQERAGTLSARLGKGWRVFPVGMHAATENIGP